MINSNLPNITTADSADEVKTFFDTYFVEPISFPSAEIDATIGFFEKRGFDKLASQATSIVLLQQAKIDGVNVFDLIDTLEGLKEIQLSAIVAEVLNYNRQKISTLGYRRDSSTGDLLETRNIVV